MIIISGKIFPGAILLCLTFLGPGQESEFVVLYLLTCILTAFIYLSWITNPVDLSPAYTGFITSICETGSMWIAIVVPIVVENLTKDVSIRNSYMLSVVVPIPVENLLFTVVYVIVTCCRSLCPYRWKTCCSLLCPLWWKTSPKT